VNKSGQFYDLQLRQLVGHIYFEKREFAKALPYLEKFVEAKEKVRREDLYELSFCYYEPRTGPKRLKGLNNWVVHRIHWRRTACTCWRMLI
jgi:hypothetical protein